MNKRTLRVVLTGAALLTGVAGVAASLAIPVLLLWRTDDRTLDRWSQIGQAVSQVGVFFSGIAFIGITLTLFLHLDELRGALVHLMGSWDMYSFWAKARAARLGVTSGDEAEDFFTAEIDRAFVIASSHRPRPLRRFVQFRWPWPRHQR